MHAEQSIACMKAGKHVQVEIPLADSLAGAQDVVRVQRETGKFEKYFSDKPGRGN